MTTTITINERNITFNEDTFVKQWVLQLTAAARYFGKGLTEVGQFMTRTGSTFTGQRLINAANDFAAYEITKVADDDVNDIITFRDGDTWCERKKAALTKGVELIEEAIDFAKSVQNTDLAADLTMCQLYMEGECKKLSYENNNDVVHVGDFSGMHEKLDEQAIV